MTRSHAGRRRRVAFACGPAASLTHAVVLALGITAFALGAAGVGLAGAATGASRPAAVATWRLGLAIHYLPPATNHSRYEVVLAEPGVTWFFGGSNVGGRSRPEVERLRNGHPASAQLPAGPHSWITAVSATSRRDIWAVTYLGGSVLRWNGAAWATVPRGTWQPGTRFTGVAAVGPRDVWVFGTTSVHNIGAGTWHFSGTSWKRAKGAGAGVYQASVAAPGDIWGIGVIRTGFGAARNRALFQFSGSKWRRATPPALAGFLYSHVLALGPHDVWVAGSVAGRPELGHYNGRRWTAVAMPGQVAATGMCRDGRGGIWVVANSGTGPSVMRHRSAGGAWTSSEVSASRASEILDCALEPGTTAVWGAGVAAAPQGSAAAGYRNG